MPTPPQTVAETNTYTARAAKLMTAAERDEALIMIASDPLCGDLIKETGGIRKVRFGIAGRGKRGGVRIIYFFHNETMPIFLLTVFAKNEQSDLAASERKALAKLTAVLVDTYGRRS